MITEEEIKWLLRTMKGIQFFASFTPDTIDSFISKIEKYSYPKGADIIKEGEPGKAFYIIYKGKVKVWKKKGLFFKTTIAELKEGDFFGEMSIVRDEPCSATVTAVEPVEVFVLFRYVFQQLLKSNPELLDEIRYIIEKRQFGQPDKK
jgi:CRP-like cAMP-binding protein